MVRMKGMRAVWGGLSLHCSRLWVKPRGGSGLAEPVTKPVFRLGNCVGDVLLRQPKVWPRRNVTPKVRKLRLGTPGLHHGGIDAVYANQKLVLLRLARDAAQ